MLVSDKFNAVYLHNPKTGGCSMTKLLTENFGFEHHADPEGWHGAVHERHRYELPDEWRERRPFVFTTVRHPLRRILSLWRYYQHPSSFAEFIESHNDAMPPQLKYAEAAHIWIFSERMREGVRMLPFARGFNDMPIPMENRSDSDQHIEEGLACRQRVGEIWSEDFKLLGYSVWMVP